MDPITSSGFLIYEGTGYHGTILHNRDGLCPSGFGAPPGRILIILDYVQIELMVAAFLSQDPAMLAAIMAGLDLHRQTAALILRIALEAVEEPERQTAKRSTSGFSSARVQPGWSITLALITASS